MAFNGPILLVEEVSIRLQSAVAVEGEVWGIDEQEPHVVMLYSLHRFLYGPCMIYVCLIL
jgi:hypothetical protein